MWVIFLGDLAFYSKAYTSAKSRNLKVCVISETLGVSSAYVDRYLVATLDSIDSILDLISSSGIASEKIIQVMSFQEKYLNLSSDLNVALNLEPLHSKDEYMRVKDKFRLRNLLNSTSLNLSYSVLVRENIDAFRLPESDSLKWVAKPFLGYSSIGVEVFDDKSDLEAVAERCFRGVERVNQTLVGVSDDILNESNNKLLVEEYVEGTEIAVDVFFLNSSILFYQISEKTKMREPYFEEVSYITPAEVNEISRNRIYVAVNQLLQALDVTNGVAHVELIFNESKIIVLDVGLRIGGSGLSDLLAEYSAGVDLMGSLYDYLLGISISERLNPKFKSISILYLMQVASGGCVLRLPTLEEVKEIFTNPIIYNTKVFVGDQLEGYPTYSGLPGFILSSLEGLSSDNYVLARKLIGSALLKLNPTYAVNQT